MQEDNKKSGFLISIEGIDGSGKSSIASYLFNELKNLYYDVILTKEPGATNLGKTLRSILQDPQSQVCSKAEFLLFAADRAQHIWQVVNPALLSGKIVISDRMADSSLAYQGYGRGLDLNIISQVNNWATDNLVPDLTIYIKIDYKTAFNRLKTRNENLTKIEQEKSSFFERVISGFETIFATRQNLLTIDGCKDLESVQKEVLNKVLEIIKNKYNNDK